MVEESLRSSSSFHEDPFGQDSSPSPPSSPPTPPMQDEAGNMRSPSRSEYDSDFSSHECTSECEEYSDADAQFKLAEEVPDSV
jgi:hypothetical protein